jgi:hypothetical protein
MAEHAAGFIKREVIEQLGIVSGSNQLKGYHAFSTLVGNPGAPTDPPTEQIIFELAYV